MSSAQATYSPVSNPQRVLTMIDAGGKNLSSLFNRLSEAPVSPPASPTVSHLKLHIDSEPSDLSDPSFGWAGPEPVPPQQVEQLVKHLRNRQRELDQREADLQAAVYRWEQKVMVENARYRKRTGELEQHLGHVKAQQEQLVKLQQNLVDSQTALRHVIEKIVDDCPTSELKPALESLKIELTEMMASILKQWEKVRSQLLAASQSVLR